MGSVGAFPYHMSYLIEAFFITMVFHLVLHFLAIVVTVLVGLFSWVVVEIIADIMIEKLSIATMFGRSII